MNIVRRSLTSYVMAASAFMSAAQAWTGPVQVFVLAGQSSMEGKGPIKHLEQLLADPVTAKTYRHLTDGDE